MREILFRGIDISNGNWAYGGISIRRYMSVIIDHGNKHYVDAKTVGQFTGLYSYNYSLVASHHAGANKVFEGDKFIVDGIGECFIEINSYYGTCFVDSDGFRHPVIDVISENDAITPAGNIHEAQS